MNAELLAGVLAALRALEKEQKLGEILDDFVVKLGALVGSPGDGNTQKEFSAGLARLRTAFAQAEATISPQRKRALEDLDLLRWFSSALPEEIAKAIASNTVTLSIGHDEATKLAQARKTAIQTIKDTHLGLRQMGIDPPEVDHEDPEMGFTIPRKLFGGDIDGLNKELRQLSMIVKAFASLHGKASDPIKIQSISTSDPVFWIVVAWLTAREIGKGVRWGLETLLVYEQLKQSRATAKSTGIFTEQQLEEFFDRRVKIGIAQEIEKKAAELVSHAPAKGKKQLQNSLEQALAALLARLERGLQVELRLPPPPATPAAGDEPPKLDGGELVSEVYAELKRIDNDLQFPPESATPMLALENLEPESNQASTSETTDAPAKKEATKTRVQKE